MTQGFAAILRETQFLDKETPSWLAHPAVAGPSSGRPVERADREPVWTWYGMHMFSERTQVLLSPDQLGRLKRIASRDGRSVGAVIREAVDAFVEAEPDRRRRAARRLLAMNAPVEDWDVMKAQILKSQLGDW